MKKIVERCSDFHYFGGEKPTGLAYNLYVQNGGKHDTKVFNTEEQNTKLLLTEMPETVGEAGRADLLRISSVGMLCSISLLGINWKFPEGS